MRFNLLLSQWRNKHYKWLCNIHEKQHEIRWAKLVKYFIVCREKHENTPLLPINQCSYQYWSGTGHFCHRAAKKDTITQLLQDPEFSRLTQVPEILCLFSHCCDYNLFLLGEYIPCSVCNLWMSGKDFLILTFTHARTNTHSSRTQTLSGEGMRQQLEVEQEREQGEGVSLFSPSLSLSLTHSLTQTHRA